MVVRHTRVCVLSLFVLSVIYWTFLFCHKDADLPEWAKLIKHSNWTQAWPTYDLEFVKQEIYHSLGTKKGNDSSLEERATSTTSDSDDTTHTPSSTEQKPKLPAFLTGPSKHAYVFSVTSNELACAALVNIDRLTKAFRTRHRIFVLVYGEIASEYLAAIRSYNATVVGEFPPLPDAGEVKNYKSLFRLQAFRLHKVDKDIKRVLFLESDSMMLDSLDSLFELPSVDLAATRAHGSEGFSITSSLMLISPNDRVWDKVDREMEKAKPDLDVDTIVNRAFERTALILPGSYNTPISHWDKWDMPDWFRPEEIAEIQEAGRITGSYGLVSQKTPGNIAKLGWAVNQWKEDFGIPDEEDLEEDRLQLEQSTKGDTGERNEDDRSSSSEQQDWAKEHKRLKRDAQGMDHDHPELASNEEDKTQEGSLTTDSLPDPANKQPEVLKNPHEDAPTTTASESEPTPTEIDKRALEGPLFDLHHVVQVLQFGKERPWQRKAAEFRLGHEGAHQMWIEHFKQWREAAQRVCPVVNKTYTSHEGEKWKEEMLVKQI